MNASVDPLTPDQVNLESPLSDAVTRASLVDGCVKNDGAKNGAKSGCSRRTLIISSLLLLFLFGNGCTRLFGFGDTRTQRERSTGLLSDVVMVDVDMYDSYYGSSDTNLTDPPVWTVKSGADVVVNLVNHGLLDHNWAVVKQGLTIPVPYEEGQAGDIILHGVGMVYNNSQTTITFTAPESGEYQVICTVSGHYPLMQGKLQVVDGD